MPVWSRIPEIMATAQVRAEMAVEKATFEVERRAKERARVDTGFMRGEIQAAPGEDALEQYVIAGADYTIHHEFGTHKMEAQPMLTPAVEEVRPEFEAAMARIYL